MRHNRIIRGLMWERWNVIFIRNECTWKHCPFTCRWPVVFWQVGESVAWSQRSLMKRCWSSHQRTVENKKKDLLRIMNKIPDNTFPQFSQFIWGKIRDTSFKLRGETIIEEQSFENPSQGQTFLNLTRGPQTWRLESSHIKWSELGRCESESIQDWISNSTAWEIMNTYLCTNDIRYDGKEWLYYKPYRQDKTWGLWFIETTPYKPGIHLAV